MVSDLERRVDELRFLEGIEKAEHVPYPTGDEFWVHFERPLDMARLLETVNKHNLQLVRFGALPSKLPRRIAEMLWDGVMYVILKSIGFAGLLKAFLGIEPDGVAKIARDLHSSDQIFIAKNEEGIEVLYDYLDMKYVPPTPTLPKATTPTKPVPAKPTPTPSRVTATATAPPTDVAAQVKPPSTPPVQPSKQEPIAASLPSTVERQPAQTQTGQAAVSEEKQEKKPAPSGQYKPHAWGSKITTQSEKAE
jgi:hypothetical protein